MRRSRFVAPKRVESFEDVRRALALVQEQLDATQPVRNALLTKDTTLRAGESVRISPRGGATLFAKLPKASAENFGQRVHVQIERPNGTVRITAQPPDTVSGLTAASFTLAGLVVLESNGVDQWVLSNQLPTNSPAAATNYFFSNANNVSFGTVGSTVTASVTVASTQGSIRVNTVLSSAFSFVNSNNVSWTVDATGGIVASATVASTQGSIRVLAGTGNVLSSQFSFVNANNVSWTLATNGLISASASFPAQTAFVLSNANGLTWGTAGSTVTGSFSTVVFSNANNVTLGFAAGTLTASATVVATRQLGVVSHLGGNVVSSVGTLAFSNANNVTWSLSTAAGGATVIASVAAGGGGGIALADALSTISSGTVVLSNATSITNFAFSSVSAQNVVFSLSGQSLAATALMRFEDGTNSTLSGGFLATKIQFASSNGISFGLATTNDAQGRNVVLTASYAPLAIQAVIYAGTAPVSAGTVHVDAFAVSDDQRGYRPVRAGLSNTSLMLDWEPPRLGGLGIWNQISGTDVRGISFNTAIPFFFAPFPSGQLPIWGKGNEDHRAGDWFVLLSGNSSATNAASTFSTNSLFITAELGLYSVEGSIGSRLLLVNSASRAFTFASSQGSRYHGVRWLEFDQSNWASSTGPLTYGEYYCAIRLLQNNVGNSTATSGRNDIRVSLLGASANGAATGIRGLFGVGAAADSKWAGWAGHFSATTGGLPGTVVSSNLVSSIANAAFVPGISIRANGVSAGWPGP